MSNDHSLHAKLPPSSAARWTRCPGSIAITEELLKKYGPGPSNPAADRGTQLHDIAAQVWAGNMALADIEDDDDRDLIAGYLGQLAEYRDMFGMEPHVEVKVQAPRWCNDVWGTVDALYIGDIMIVFDLKTGYIPVVAEENLQLLCYAALAREHYNINPGTILLAIWQPNARDGLGALREWEITGLELDRYAAEIKHAAGVATSPAGALAFYPGQDQCQWCPAGGHCKAQARSQAVLDFFEESPPVNIISEEEMADLLDTLPAVDKFISQLRAAGLERALAGDNIPGWKVVTAQTKRRWSNPAAVEAALRKAKRPVHSFMDMTLKTFTKLLKDPRAAPIISEFIIKPVGGPVLANLADPREDYIVADEFAEADKEAALEK